MNARVVEPRAERDAGGLQLAPHGATIETAIMFRIFVLLQQVPQPQATVLAHGRIQDSSQFVMILAEPSLKGELGSSLLERSVVHEPSVLDHVDRGGGLLLLSRQCRNVINR